MDRIPPDAPEFTQALRGAGIQRWSDPSLPYRLAGGGMVLRAMTGSGIGVLGLAIRQGYWKGEEISVAILRDLAVEPQARGKGMAKRLVQEALAASLEAGARIALFPSSRSTAELSALERGWQGVPPFCRVGLFTTIRIVPALWRWEEPEYKVFRAGPQDVPALARHLDLYRRGLAFAPPTNEAGFKAALEACPGFSVADFRIARFRDEMVAMAGIWEPGQALPVAMPAATPLEHIVGGIGRTLGRLSPVVRLPKEGSPLRVRFLRAYAIRREHHAAFRHLVDRAANEARKSGAHALEFTVPQGDPILGGIRGRVRRIATRSLWALALTDEVSLGDSGPLDAGILDPAL
ncbi:MAG: GNAT family N-acetyltransferase [Cyanobacteria bacterium REEB65]|nr:GNAT family N-acetyltransferase [Cyanobacteria bacterium REEB65]